jgi:hypothetical protein
VICDTADRLQWLDIRRPSLQDWCWGRPFGRTGKGPGKFSVPIDCVQVNHALVVLEAQGARVQVLGLSLDDDSDSGSGGGGGGGGLVFTPRHIIGGSGQFAMPMSLALPPAGVSLGQSRAGPVAEDSKSSASATTAATGTATAIGRVVLIGDPYPDIDRDDSDGCRADGQHLIHVLHLSAETTAAAADGSAATKLPTLSLLSGVAPETQANVMAVVMADGGPLLLIIDVSQHMHVVDLPTGALVIKHDHTAGRVAACLCVVDEVVLFGERQGNERMAIPIAELVRGDLERYSLMVERRTAAAEADR